MAKTANKYNSRSVVDITEYAYHYNDTESALRLYFNSAAIETNSHYVGFTRDELGDVLKRRLDEVELTAVMTIIAALEAAFVIDYKQRCRRQPNDALTRALLKVYRRHQKKNTSPKNSLRLADVA